MRYLAHLAHETTARVSHLRQAPWLPRIAPLVEESVVEWPATTPMRQVEHSQYSPLETIASSGQPQPRVAVTESEPSEPPRAELEVRRDNATVEERQETPRSKIVRTSEQPNQSFIKEVPLQAQMREVQAAASGRTEAIAQSSDLKWENSQRGTGRELPHSVQRAESAAVPRQPHNTQKPKFQDEEWTEEKIVERPTLRSILAHIAERQRGMDAERESLRERTELRAPEERRFASETGVVSRGDGSARRDADSRASATDVRLNIGSIVVQIEPDPIAQPARSVSPTPQRQPQELHDTSNRWARSFLDR